MSSSTTRRYEASSPIGFPAHLSSYPADSWSLERSRGIPQDRPLQECRTPESSTPQWIASRHFESDTGSTKRPSLSILPSYSRIAAPARYPGLGARLHSVCHCRCRSQQHPDALSAGSDRQPGSSEPTPFVACGSSLAAVLFLACAVESSS